MEEMRANPDSILQNIKDNDILVKGHLKIFFGYAAGVGKTYAMLQAAHTAKKRGVDVVAGYVEPHERINTSKLLDGLESTPLLRLTYKGIQVQEFDLDAILARKPQLVLVDELAHTNSERCRHAKRYQDVQELLKAGIHVYTTVNVQHIESLHDIVAAITGVCVQERIPDSIFDDADQVELVDIEPEDLLIRLKAGEVYKHKQVEQALNRFFKIDNLTALREIALRRCADRMNLLSKKARSSKRGDYYTDEHILVCLSSSPSNEKIIRTASRMASAFRGRFTALFVETSEFPSISEENKNRIRKHIRLAQQLGATIETVFGDDVALQISEFAHVAGVSKIVIGRSEKKNIFLLRRSTLVDQLNVYAPNLDIYIIPNHHTTTYDAHKTKQAIRLSGLDILKSIVILISASLIGFLFYHLQFSEANIITIYILGVLFIAMVTDGKVYSSVSSIVSVLVFNYLFTEPRFTLNAYDKGYPITFLVMLIAAFTTSTMVVKIKQHARVSAQVAYRTKLLLETNQLLQVAKSRKEIVDVISNQLLKLLKKDIVFYLSEQETLSNPCVYLVESDGDEKRYTSENERAVAHWVFTNNKHAGATTNTLGSAKCLYLSIRVNEVVYGVVGIAMDEHPLDAFENNIVLSILGECALTLEREKALREKAHSELVAKNEKLRANLLRSISHDLRTPLTSISGNAGILLASSQNLEEAKKKRLYQDINKDANWLINLVENLLSITRLEDGTMQIHKTAELLDEVISEALQHVDSRSTNHHILVQKQDDFLIAKMDARLIVQVIINIVNNAIKYSPKQTTINISSGKEKEQVYIEVADCGDGVSDAGKDKIFDMFFTDNIAVADSRRSLGLGLYLCKAIVNAHGGVISVRDNHPKGTIFRFTLPAEEVLVHE